MEETMPKAALEWARRWAPELVLAGLAGVVFLAFLGSVDLWGKREQRASAEAIDTVQQGHWLVAQIQSRPRLEKPPLPRWTIAILMGLTGRGDEWIVRLPSALSALGMVALVYALGCRLGGREVGLASGLVLSSLGFFISELRQAGNDGPLAFFTTLALYAAWRRLHGTPEPTTPDDAGVPQAKTLGSPRWLLLMYLALGLGFLTKGPIVVVLVVLTLVPYLATVRRLREGLKSLWSAWGLVLFLILALSWPVPVLLNDPKAAEVWYLEMAQKTASAGIQHHRQRLILAMDWPWMTAPFVLVATTAVVVPLLTRGRNPRPQVWFPWWWAVGNLAMFCIWKVAKPNYYLPCVPGAALLTGIEWVRLTRAARELGRPAARARLMLQTNWVLLFTLSVMAPVLVGRLAPRQLSWALLLCTIMAVAVVMSAWLWRRGANAVSLAPMTGALAIGVVIGYGLLAPADNPVHSHRALASTLDRMLPPDAKTIMFFHELDEGLWFYLRDRALEPVPGSQPKYNETVDMMDEFRQNGSFWDPNERLNTEKAILLEWLRKPDRQVPYLLIRARVYDRYAPDLAGLVTPLYREHGLKRNELVLLRAEPAGGVASGSGQTSRR
jgi:4-amino-4-deoxy-L-arabinose transferase-like glycosyltransferase